MSTEVSTSEGTCPELVWKPGWYHQHTCGRPNKRKVPLYGWSGTARGEGWRCGVHASMYERRKTAADAREVEWQAQRERRDATEKRRSDSADVLLNLLVLDSNPFPSARRSTTGYIEIPPAEMRAWLEAQ